MVRRGADTIVLASCITKGNPIGFACPHVEKMKEAIVKKLGDDIKSIDYTHWLNEELFWRELLAKILLNLLKQYLLTIK